MFPALLEEVELVPVFAFRKRTACQEIFLRIPGGELGLRYKLNCINLDEQYDPHGEQPPMYDVND